MEREEYASCEFAKICAFRMAEMRGGVWFSSKSNVDKCESSRQALGKGNLWRIYLGVENGNLVMEVNI